MNSTSVIGPAAPPDVTRILVVDDEPIVTETIGGFLTMHGFECAEAGSGEAALATLDQRSFDLVVLDVGLPGMSGYQTCTEIKVRGEIPVIFLTAAHELPARLKAFDVGGDDYVMKPVALSELVRRVRAVLRRGQPHVSSAAYALRGPRGLTLNWRTRETRVNGTPMTLTARAFDLLRTLLERRGEVLSAETIALSVWGHGTFGERNFIEAQVSRLRAELSRAGADDVIETVRGVGYAIRLCPVSEVRWSETPQRAVVPLTHAPLRK